MILNQWSDNQRRVFIDTAQVYDAFIQARDKSRTYAGGMHWKRAKGRQYLFRTRDRYGNGKSLGPRSPETEQIFARFHADKQAAKERLDQLKARLDEQARFCKAAYLQRVPRLVTGILRLLEGQRLLGKNLVVAGTHALYAYEARAGVFLDAPLLATGDLDIVWDTRPKLKLIGDPDVERQGLLGILKKADRSFEPIRRRGFRAVNQAGFMVDLIKPEPRDIRRTDRRRMGQAGDLEAAEVRNLQWLLNFPKFLQIAIGDDGYPAPMAAPDPRAFCLHKLWLSQQSDREPVKRGRDESQALAVAHLITAHLPEYPFEAKALCGLPPKLLEALDKWLETEKRPVGLE